MEIKSSSFSIGLCFLLLVSFIFSGWMIFYPPKMITKAPPFYLPLEPETTKIQCPNPTTAPPPCICESQQVENPRVALSHQDSFSLDDDVEIDDEYRHIWRLLKRSPSQDQEEQQLTSQWVACRTNHMEKKTFPLLEKPESEMTNKEKRESWINHCRQHDEEACRKLFFVHDEECKQRKYDSCVFTAWSLLNGRAGIPANPQAGFAILEETCSQGHTFACHNLGYQLEKGREEFPKDINRALTAFQASCNLDPMRGCDDAGRLLEQNAKENPTQLEQAFQNYQKACNAENSLGCYYAFVLNEKKGIASPQEKMMLEQQLKTLCENKKYYACRALVIKMTGSLPTSSTKESNDL